MSAHLRLLKRGLLRFLSLPAITAPLAPLTRGRVAIFMLHRFRHGDVEGHDVESIRRVLAHLRRQRYDLISLDQAFRRLMGEGEPLRRAVAFTIDDGYADHASQGAPLFAEFDCPVTTFVTTGFVDGQNWMWWDQIEYLIARTRRPVLTVELADTPMHLAVATPEERAQAQQRFTQDCKRVTDAEKHRAIARLSVAAEVELPARAPERYRAMTWTELRRAEEQGMTFAPHTVTHPVLSRTSDAQSRFEILESWKSLRREARAPVPVFCYPNGSAVDFGAREIDTLREAGFLGAVVGDEGYGETIECRSGAEGRFRVPRFVDCESLPHVVQYASGLEQLKRLVRSPGAK